MKKIIKTFAFTLIISLISFKAPLSYAGTFIDNNTYLTDLESKLDWLDVTLTTGFSYTEVSNQLEQHGPLNGWRYATKNELTQLINNFTNSAPTISGTVQGTSDTIYYVPSNLLDPLVSALGSTLDIEFTSSHGSSYDAFYGYAEGEGIDFTMGFIFTPNEDNTLNVAEINDNEITAFSLIDGSTLTSADFYSFGSFSLGRDEKPSLNTGSYLVRDTITQFVPIPSAIWFLGSSLLALFSFYGRKKA